MFMLFSSFTISVVYNGKRKARRAGTHKTALRSRSSAEARRGDHGGCFLLACRRAVLATSEITTRATHLHSSPLVAPY